MRTISKKIKKIFGILIFTIGLIGLALPIIPGWLLIFAGLAVI